MVSPHFAEHYQKFKDWWVASYNGINRQCIPYQSRFESNPQPFSMEQVMWDAWLRGYMTRDQQDKDKHDGKQANKG